MLGLSIRLHRLTNEFAEACWSPMREDAPAIAEKIEDVAAKVRALGENAPPVLAGRAELALANVDLQLWLRFRYQGFNAGQEPEPPWHRFEALTQDARLPAGVRLEARLAMARSRTIVAANNMALDREVGDETLVQLGDEAAQVSEGFRTLGDVRHALEADLLHGELLGALEDPAAGARIQAVLGDCERLDLPLKDNARRALEGKGIFGIIEFVRRRPSPDDIVLNMQGPEREIYTRRLMQMLKIDRAEVERRLDWMAADARERRDYCRHLHAHEVDVTYMIYRCAARGLVSAVPRSDREPLLARFKAERCLACGLRSPKRLTGHLEN